MTSQRSSSNVRAMAGLSLPWLSRGRSRCWCFPRSPYPANDSFFYDGAVVHFLQHGGYFESLGLAGPADFGHGSFQRLPAAVSAGAAGVDERVFGTSALYGDVAAHGFARVFPAGGVLAIFPACWAEAPAWCVDLGGLFLFSLTFHGPPPDSLAQVFGRAAYTWVRARSGFASLVQNRSTDLWLWLTTLFVVLTSGTSLQIGAVYFGWIWLATLMDCGLSRRRFPVLPMAAMVLTPVALVALVADSVIRNSGAASWKT